MKNMQRTLVLILAVAVALGASAAQKKKTNSTRKYTQDIHYVSMWGGLGYSGLVNGFKGGEYTDLLGNTSTFNSKFIGGGGGMLGVGYEFHKYLQNSRNYFIFAVGPEFRCFTSQDNFKYTLGDGVLNQYNAQQPDYSSMVQHYDFSRFHETNVIGQLMIPILVGGQFADNRYYVLAGAKVGWSVFDAWRQRGRLTTSVTEQMAMEDWYDVPSHDLITESKLLDHPLYQSSSKGTNKFGMFGGLDASVYAEFGVNLNEFFPDKWQSVNEGKKHPWLMRVGAFIDYGIPNLNTQTNGYQETASGEPLVNAIGSSVSTNSLYQSRWADSRVNSLIVGVKFTALLQLNKPKEPNPRMNILVLDSLSRKPIPMAQVSIQPERVVHFSGKGKAPKARPAKKMKKDGTLTARYAKDTYYLNALETPAYLASDTVVWQLETDNKYDTVRIAQIPRPRLVSYIHDAATEQIIGGAIEYKSDQTGDVNTMSSRADVNSCEVELVYGNTYRLHITAPEHHDTTAIVTNLYDTTHYYLRPIRRVRRTLILKHMYFATDKTNILSASEPDLMILYNFLAENPKIRVLITGHTDSQGTDAYNQKLSEGRSASVKQEMVKRGIDPDRMETDGKGESEPIDTNDTDEGRQNNRRVQVTVLNAEDATVDVY